MSLSRMFEISKNTLAVYQRALETTSNNISNSANVDYTRQTVNFKAGRYENVSGYSLGTGVTIDNITRVRNNLIDNQIRSNNQNYSYNNARNTMLGEIEQVFTEPSDLGLSSLMNNFYNSWQELSVTPNSSSLRNDVLRSAQKLSAQVQTVYDGLSQIQSDTLSQIKEKVSSLNSSLHSVQELNAQIFQLESTGQNANGLLDQRDKVLDELSNYANISITIDSSNSAIVSVGGVFAADRGNVNEFKMVENNGQIQIVSSNDNTAAVLTGGELTALTDIYSNEIPKYLDNINEIFSTFAQDVNTVHKTGYTLEEPPKTGSDFFTYKDGVLTISQDLLDNPSKIAASADGTEGNGDIAIKIADLAKNSKINGNTLQDVYSAMISDVGSKKLLAEQSTDSYQLVAEQLDTQKTSYSGVSVDEEMTNVIKFQRSYNAAAKLIKVADDMLETILNMV